MTQPSQGKSAGIGSCMYVSFISDCVIRADCVLTLRACESLGATRCRSRSVDDGPRAELRRRRDVSRAQDCFLGRCCVTVRDEELFDGGRLTLRIPWHVMDVSRYGWSARGSTTALNPWEWMEDPSAAVGGGKDA